jgi:hypothetical protein
VKKYKKGYTDCLRMTVDMNNRLNALSDQLQMDRADMHRMALSNFIKFWENKFNGQSTSIPRNVDKKTPMINEVSQDELDALSKEMEQFK